MTMAAAVDTARTEPNELLRRWQECHDERAREAFVERFMPLARSLARRYRRSSEPFEDLVQVANLGLVKAMERFDPGRGHAFSSFAVPTILGELKRYFRDSGWSVHVPRGAQERARQVEEAERAITSRTGRSPTVAELAQYLECSDEEVLDGLDAAHAYATMSLDAPRPTEDDGGDTYGESIGVADHHLELVDAAVTAGAAARHLPPRERRILYLRFVEDLTQTEIAKQIGVSQMQVSRLLRKSIRSLQELTGQANDED
jgi:RNA polymerase sigma-B factor